MIEDFHDLKKEKEKEQWVSWRTQAMEEGQHGQQDLLVFPVETPLVEPCWMYLSRGVLLLDHVNCFCFDIDTGLCSKWQGWREDNDWCGYCCVSVEPDT